MCSFPVLWKRSPSLLGSTLIAKHQISCKHSGSEIHLWVLTGNSDSQVTYDDDKNVRRV